MNRVALGAAALLSAVTIAAPANAATNFVFDEANSYITITSNDTICVFGTCSLDADLALPFESFSLDVGQSRTFDFADLFVSSGFGGGTATIDAQLAFLLPDADPAGNGAGASYLRLGGIFTPGALVGDLIWDTPSQQVVATDGTVFTVAFTDLIGAQFGGGVAAPVTITLDSAAPVPEPATWAMMIAGFGAVGVTMRRRKAQALKVSFRAA